MTATTPPGPIDQPLRAGRERAPQRPWRWHVSRAGALLLVVLVPLHFVVTFIHDDIGDTTARSISERLDDPTWRLLTWLMLALALVHGTLAADAAIRRRFAGGGGLAMMVIVGVVAGAGLAAVSWVLFRAGI